RLEPDLLHAEMAGGMIGDPAERCGERPFELPFAVKLHEILAEVVHPRDYLLGRRARDQPRVLVLQHAATARPRHHDVAAGCHGTTEALEVATRPARRARDVTPVERRHPAADLRRAC